jgi:nucleoside-diphosphate-sugar epimerase
MNSLEKSAAITEESKGLVALTGASGFIGKVLLSQLLSDGWRVRILTRSPQKYQSNGCVEIFTGDFTKDQNWNDFVSGVDVVINAAAEIHHTSMMDLINHKAPEKILMAAVNTGVRRWVQLSSVGAYGPLKRGIVNENSPEAPCGVYEETKTAFDQTLRSVSEKNQIEVCIIRPSNVYGPEMTNQSLFKMINMIALRIFFFVGRFGASANYIHVKDVVNAILLCAKSPKAANKTYIISDWAAIEDMVLSITRAINGRRIWLRLPLAMVLFFAYLLERIPGCPLTVKRVRAMSSFSRYSTKAIEKDLGWCVQTSIDSGMKELVSKKLNEKNTKIY